MDGRDSWGSEIIGSLFEEKRKRLVRSHFVRQGGEEKKTHLSEVLPARRRRDERLARVGDGFRETRELRSTSDAGSGCW